jgi:acetylglutamate kinase
MSKNGPITLIKIGGSTLGAEDTSLADVAALQAAGERVVIVHGGGPEITSWMGKLGIRAEFVRGLRVTDGPSLEVATAVLAGLINKRLVAALAAEGARAVGLCGADGGLVRGAITDPALGRVAGAVAIDPAPVLALLKAGYVPVIAPIGAEDAPGGGLVNVNADTVAGSIAVALGAARLVYLTDVDGVMDANGRVLPLLSPQVAEGLMHSGVAKGGMIPKLEACVGAARGGLAAHIVNGTRSGALRAVLEGKAGGTTVRG